MKSEWRQRMAKKREEQGVADFRRKIARQLNREKEGIDDVEASGRSVAHTGAGLQQRAIARLHLPSPNFGLLPQV